MSDPYIVATPNGLIRASDWNSIQVQARAEIHGHGHTGETDGTPIGTNGVVDLAVTTAKLANLAVSTAKLTDFAVTSSKLAELSVGTVALADDAITTEKVAPGAISADKIQDDAIQFSMIAQSTLTQIAAAVAPIPPGVTLAFSGESTPEGWLFCEGQAVGREEYSALFAAIGISHGSGDGVTSFRVPDFRGRFLRGTDEGAERDPDVAARASMNPGGNVGGMVGTVQSDALQSHGHSLSGPTVYGDDPIVTIGAAGGPLDLGPVGPNVGNPSATTAGPARHTGETRPRNAYVRWIIKT